MTSAALRTSLDRLADALAYDGEDLNERFEVALDVLAKTKDSETIDAMFLLFDDHYDIQHLMWALLHCVETFDKDRYVAAYFRVVVAMQAQAPEWAQTVLLRCLNADVYREAVADALKTSSEAQAMVIRTMCANLVCRDPARFAAKVAHLPLGAASNQTKR